MAEMLNKEWLKRWHALVYGYTWQRRILHEAGHMTYLNVTHPELKANYGKSNADPRPDYMYVTAPMISPADEIGMLLAGDMAVIMSRNPDYDCGELMAFAYAHKCGISKGSDQQRLHEILKKIPGYGSDMVRFTAYDVQDLFLDHWDKLMENFWIADAFYDGFWKLPRLLHYLEDERTAYKILGDDIDRIDEIKKDLLDPEKSFNTCKNLGVRKLDD